MDFSKLKPDSDGKINTSHRIRWDLRNLSTGGSGFANLNINHIDTITFRYMTPTSDKTQYNSGKTPKIWFGKIVAYTEKDNFHPGFSWRNSAGVSYTEGANNNNPESQQATLMAMVGENRWNQTTKVVFPAWADFDGYRVIGLDWGDRSTSTNDYSYGCLDRYMWRWKRYEASNASHTGSISFPSSPVAAGGGGNKSTDIRRQQTQWLSDTTHGSFVG